MAKPPAKTRNAMPAQAFGQPAKPARPMPPPAMGTKATSKPPVKSMGAAKKMAAY